jgi:hypothetical protein
MPLEGPLSNLGLNETTDTLWEHCFATQFQAERAKRHSISLRYKTRRRGAICVTHDISHNKKQKKAPLTKTETR